MRKPRVAIDVRELANPHRAGKVNVLYFMLRELLARKLTWEPILYGRTPITDPPIPAGVDQRKIAGLPGLRAWWLARDIERQQAALAIFPTGYHVAPFMRRPYILFVYDLAAFSPYAGTLPWRTRWAERIGLSIAVRSSAHIVAISEFTKRELIERFHIPAGKVTVIPLAADAAFRPSRRTSKERLTTLRKRYNLPSNFLLFVGTLEPRKNISRLLAAYAMLPRELRKQYPLLLVGKDGWLSEPLEKMIGRFELKQQVRQLSYVPFADLPGFYQMATALVYPSLYEGFGLPPLEAMASGCPVITSNISSLPEVVGDAALTVNPEKTEELSAAMAKIITDAKLRDSLRQKGLARARLFSWTKAAQIVDEVISQTLRDQLSS